MVILNLISVYSLLAQQRIIHHSAINTGSLKGRPTRAATYPSVSVKNIFMNGISSASDKSSSCQFVNKIPLHCATVSFKSRSDIIKCYNSKKDDNITENDVQLCMSDIKSNNYGLPKLMLNKVKDWLRKVATNMETFNIEEMQKYFGTALFGIEIKIQRMLNAIEWSIKSNTSQTLLLPTDDVPFEDEDAKLFNAFMSARYKYLSRELGYLTFEQYIKFKAHQIVMQDVFDIISTLTKLKKYNRQIPESVKEHAHTLKKRINKLEFVQLIARTVKELIAFSNDESSKSYRLKGVSSPFDMEALSILLYQLETNDYPEWIVHEYNTLSKSRVAVISRIENMVHNEQQWPIQMKLPEINYEFEKHLMEMELTLMNWKLLYQFLVLISFISTLFSSLLSAAVIVALPVLIMGAIIPNEKGINFLRTFTSIHRECALESCAGRLAEKILEKHPEVNKQTFI